MTSETMRRRWRRVATAIAVAAAIAGLAAGRASATDHRVSPQAKEAAETVMRWYDPSTGLWRTTNWWNAANILTGLMDLDLKDHSRRYAAVAANTYERGIDQQGGDFTNQFNDDTGWWGLAWLRAYELTGERRYLETAVVDAEHMWRNRDDRCGGGIWWNQDKTYKNSITNELFIKLAAQLHNTLPHDTVWLERAEETWHWFRDSGLINPDGSISDGLNFATCRNDGTTPVWSYNQGVILGALVELDAAGDAEALPAAHRIATAAVTSPTLAPGGILADPGEPQSSGGADGPTFKGVFTRNLDELDRRDGRPLYREFLQRQARSLIGHDRNAAGQYGYHWAGPFDAADAARQGSALDALVAAEPDRVLSLAVPPAYPGGPTVVAPGQPVAPETVFVNGGRTPAKGLRVTLRAPEGWTATPVSAARGDLVRPGDSRAMTWRLEPPAGAAPGMYTIESVAEYDTPAASASHTVTASTRVLVPNPPSGCVGATGGFCPLDLADDYNHDGVATLEQTNDGNFDGLGWSYAANLLPPAGPVTLGGVPYHTPSTAGRDPNFVQAHGQPLVLAPGRYATAHVLGATHNGSVDTTATILYADGSTGTVPLRLTDWAAGPAFGNTKAIAMPYRIRAGRGRDGPPVSIFGTTLPLDSTKTVRWIALPSDPRVEVYAITVEGP